MEITTGGNLRRTSRANTVCLVHFDDAGFAASPSVQTAWSARRLPHCVEHHFHCWHTVSGAREFASNALTQHLASAFVKGGAGLEVLEEFALHGDSVPVWWYSTTSSIYHVIYREAHERRLHDDRKTIIPSPTLPPRTQLRRDRLEASRTPLAQLHRLEEGGYRSLDSKPTSSISRQIPD